MFKAFFMEHIYVSYETRKKYSRVIVGNHHEVSARSNTERILDRQ